MSRAFPSLAFIHSLHFERRSSWEMWALDVRCADDGYVLIREVLVVLLLLTYQKEWRHYVVLDLVVHWGALPLDLARLDRYSEEEEVLLSLASLSYCWFVSEKTLLVTNVILLWLVLSFPLTVCQAQTKTLSTYSNWSVPPWLHHLMDYCYFQAPPLSESVGIWNAWIEIQGIWEEPTFLLSY